MSDSRKKWEELQEEKAEKRQKIIAQNGNTGEHYFENDDPDAELPPVKEVELNEIDELTILSKPLMDYLSSNYHPHYTLIITSDSTELLESSRRIIKNK